MPSLSKFRLRVLGIAAPVEYFAIPMGRVFIGSNPGCDLYIADPQIAQRHMEITFDGNSLEITNLVNAERTQHNQIGNLDQGLSYTLQIGDILTIGMHGLIVEHVPLTVMPPITASLFEVREKQIQRSERWREIPTPLRRESVRLLQHLPEIYRDGFTSEVFSQQAANDEVKAAPLFLSRYLALFESIFLPLEWLIDNYDLNLDIETVSQTQLAWLQRWYGFEFNESWSEKQKRELLRQAPDIFRKKGTLEGLTCILSIYSQDPNLKLQVDNTCSTILVETTLSNENVDFEIREETLRNLIKLFIPVALKFELKANLAISTFL